jgi:hypothetical protein
MDELINKLKELKRIEDESFNKSLKTAEQIKEAHLKKGVLISAFDSLIHREVTNALINAIHRIKEHPMSEEERKVPDVTDVNEVIRAVDHHLSLEYKMMDEVEGLLEEISESYPGISSILRAWLADEARHHGILSKIRSELIKEGEAEKRLLP